LRTGCAGGNTEETAMQRRRAALVTIALSCFALAACGGGGGSGTTSTSSGGGGAGQVGGNVSVWAVWSGTEQKSFQAVLDKFYDGLGDQVTVEMLSAAG